jgi:hypothetical protein
MRIVGILLLLAATIASGLATLVVIGIHGACDNNCDRLVPAWPFALLTLVCAALGTAVWKSRRTR